MSGSVFGHPVRRKRRIAVGLRHKEMQEQRPVLGEGASLQLGNFHLGLRFSVAQINWTTRRITARLRSSAAESAAHS
jgi:hypothetical protein